MTWRNQTQLRNAEAVVLAVCKHLGVQVPELSEPERSARLIRARRVCAYAARTIAGASFPSCVMAMKKKDTSQATARHQYHAVMSDPTALADAERIVRKITPTLTLESDDPPHE